MLKAFKPRFIRNLSVVPQSAKPGRGLRKDLSEYTVSSNGVKYPGTQETLLPLKQLLGDEFTLPNNLLLQILVHKSFAHGKFPYNEKLSILGEKLLRLQSFRYAANEKVDLNTCMNGMNFNITKNAVELLSSSVVLANVCDKFNLTNSLFYKHGQPQVSKNVKSKAVEAIIGALIFEKGTETAIKFINTKLLSGELNLFKIADSLYIE